MKITSGWGYWEYNLREGRFNLVASQISIMDQLFKTVLWWIYVTREDLNYVTFLNHSNTMPPGGTVNESLSHECSMWAVGRLNLRRSAFFKLNCRKCNPNRKDWLNIYFPLVMRVPLVPYSQSKSACVFFYKYWIPVLIQLTSKCSGSERGCCIHLKHRSNLAGDTGETNPMHMQESRRAFNIISKERWAIRLFFLTLWPIKN